MSDQTIITEGRTDFSLESLSTEEISVRNALLMPNFSDDESILPHSVDIAGLDKFNVEILTVSGWKCIDLLIGQACKNLLTVLHRSENNDLDKSNCVLTKLGPIASGGHVCPCCTKFKADNVDLKQSLCELNLADEAMEPFRNDEIAKQLVEND